MTAYFYNISEWYPGAKRPFCSRDNLNSFMEAHLVGTQTSSTWWFPNSPQELTYFDADGGVSTNGANYIVIQEMTGSGTKWGYFVENGRSLTSGVYRFHLRYDGYVSYILQRNPTTLVVRRAHIVGAYGGGLDSEDEDTIPASVLPYNSMAVTTTQPLELVKALPIGDVNSMDLVVAFTFTNGPSTSGRRNFLFLVGTGDGLFNGYADGDSILSSLASVAQCYGLTYQNADWKDGVLSGAWYVPHGTVAVRSNDVGFLWYELGEVKAQSPVREVKDTAGNSDRALTSELGWSETVEAHARVGNLLRSVEVCPRRTAAHVTITYTAFGEAGQFSFGFMLDNEYTDLTDTVALPYPVVEMNAQRTQYKIADTVGIVGSSLGLVSSVAAAVPTGGASLVGVGSSLLSLGQAISDKVNRPTPNSTRPNTGLESMYACPIINNVPTPTLLCGLGLLAYQASNPVDTTDFGYPQDYWNDYAQLNYTAPAPGKGYYIRADQGEPAAAPPEYRQGIRDQLAAGVIVLNGVPQ